MLTGIVVTDDVIKHGEGNTCDAMARRAAQCWRRSCSARLCLIEIEGCSHIVRASAHPPTAIAINNTTSTITPAGNIMIQLGCKGIEKPSTFTKPDPFVMFLRKQTPEDETVSVLRDCSSRSRRQQGCRTRLLSPPPTSIHSSSSPLSIHASTRSHTHTHTHSLNPPIHTPNRHSIHARRRSLCGRRSPSEVHRTACSARRTYPCGRCAGGFVVYAQPPLTVVSV